MPRPTARRPWRLPTAGSQGGPGGRGAEPRRDREVGRHVRRHEATAGQARRPGHQHQLPGRLLRRTPEGLSLPGLQPTEQRRLGRRLRGRPDVGADHGHHGHAGRPAGLHLRSGDRHLEEPDHLRPLRGHDQARSVPRGRRTPTASARIPKTARGRRSSRSCPRAT